MTNLFGNYIDNKKTTFLFFLKQKVYWIFLVLTLAVNALIWAWLIWRIVPQEEPIPLSYNIYFGIDNLDNWSKIFWWPAVGILIILLNYFFAYLIFLKNKFLSHFLILTALFFQLFFLIFYLLLIINYY